MSVALALPVCLPVPAAPTHTPQEGPGRGSLIFLGSMQGSATSSCFPAIRELKAMLLFWPSHSAAPNPNPPSYLKLLPHVASTAVCKSLIVEFNLTPHLGKEKKIKQSSPSAVKCEVIWSHLTFILRSLRHSPLTTRQTKTQMAPRV